MSRMTVMSLILQASSLVPLRQWGRIKRWLPDSRGNPVDLLSERPLDPVGGGRIKRWLPNSRGNPVDLLFKVKG